MSRYYGIMDFIEVNEDQLEEDEFDELSSSALRPTLREDSRSRARKRIIHGALLAVASSGLDATIEEVAEAAGVSRRTVFRHFPSHGELIAASIHQGLSVVGTHIPEPPAPGTDIQQWLCDTVVLLHTVVRQLLGRAFWDIHVDRPGTPNEVIAAIEDIALQRKHFAGELASCAWIALGGDGDVPGWVVDAFLLHASGFAANAFPKYSAEETGQLSARILWVVLAEALEESKR
jgi:AcrR family transcriptional regulator